MRIQLSKLLSFLSVIILTLMIIFDMGQTVNLIAAVLVVAMFFASGTDDKVAILFFSVNLIAALKVTFFGVPLGSILEIILILDCLINSKTRVNGTQLVIISILFISATTTSLIFSESLVKPIVFAINLLMMISLFNYTQEARKEHREESIKYYFLSFVSGFAITIIISLLKTDISRITFYNRFTGLWTDPNYIGLFAAISISMLLILSNKRIGRYLICLPLILLFLFAGYLTFSRSFVFAIFIIAFYMILALLKSKRVSAIGKFAGLLVVFAVVLLAYRYYLSGIISARGILEYTGRDLTNGRIDDWQKAWTYYTSSFSHVVFGIGSSTSHNTFFDFMLKYGPIGAIIGIILISNVFSELKRYKNENNVVLLPIHRMLYFLLLVYAFTLPMLEDDLMYLLFGCVPLCYIGIDVERPHRKSEFNNSQLGGISYEGNGLHSHSN